MEGKESGLGKGGFGYREDDGRADRGREKAAEEREGHGAVMDGNGFERSAVVGRHKVDGPRRY